MGFGVTHCYLGFSIDRGNQFSEQLERRAAAMDASFRDSFFHLQLGLGLVHDAIDAALAGDATATAERLAVGLAELGQCNDQLTALAEALVRARSELLERGELEPGDPLVTREPFFAELDYEAIYQELLGAGAALPLRAFWDDVAARVRDGGTHAGMRLLDRQLRELQSDLRLFIAGVESKARLHGRAFAVALHDSSIAIAKLMVGYTRVLATFTYFTIFCERASALQERVPLPRAAAAAG